MGLRICGRVFKQVFLHVEDADLVRRLSLLVFHYIILLDVYIMVGLEVHTLHPLKYFLCLNRLLFTASFGASVYFEPISFYYRFLL